MAAHSDAAQEAIFRPPHGPPRHFWALWPFSGRLLPTHSVIPHVRSSELHWALGAAGRDSLPGPAYSSLSNPILLLGIYYCTLARHWIRLPCTKTASGKWSLRGHPTSHSTRPYRLAVCRRFSPSCYGRPTSPLLRALSQHSCRYPGIILASSWPTSAFGLTKGTVVRALGVAALDSNSASISCTD